MKVTIVEIIERLNASGNQKALDLIERITQHGIAPPDGYVLVRKELLDFIGSNMEVSGGRVYLPERAFRKLLAESMLSAVKEKE